MNSKSQKKRQLISLIEAKVRSATKSFISKPFCLTRKSLYWHSNSEARDELLKNQILDCLAVNPSYGHRRIAIALGIGKKRVRRVMRLYGSKLTRGRLGGLKRETKTNLIQAFQTLSEVPAQLLLKLFMLVILQD